MKRIFSIVLLLLCVVVFYAENADAKEASAERVSPVSRLAHSGDIKGTVKCSSDGTAKAGALVYISGMSFMAKTDSEGAFRLFNVPAGVYQLEIEIPLLPTFVEEGVRVKPKRVIELDLVVECDCVDEDGDGYGEGPECSSEGTDCNDDDDSINPGAPEECDGIDNNCNDIIDEGEDCQ